MHVSIEESQSLCDWLLDRGLELGECACVLGDLESGDSFALALLKVFYARKLKLESVNANVDPMDWNYPCSP